MLIPHPSRCPVGLTVVVLQAMTHELAYGPCIALEISDKVDPSVCPVESFREFCGPIDAQLAQALRPNTLRAHFGKNKVA